MKEVFYNNIFFHFLIMTLIFKNILNECSKDKPIFKENSCKLIYCEENDFSTNICEINNTIIKTQWLNRIIKISDNYFRFINIASNTKGDIFIETSSTSSESKRIFYALKNNGRPYFKNNENDEETPFYIMNEIETNLERHESELVNIVLNNDEKTEYLMSVSKGGIVEIYDFDAGERKYITTEQFFGYDSLSSINVPIFIELDNIYYNFFPIYCFENHYFFGQSYYIYVKKYNFNSKDISQTTSYTSKLSDPFYALDQNIISCFITESKSVGCIFYHNTKHYCLSLYDSNLNFINLIDLIEVSSFNEYTFFKGIHLKGEIIALYYYLNSNTNEDYGYLSIKQIDLSKLTCNTYNNYEDISIDKVSFYTTIFYNDFIKLNDNKLCIISYNSNHKIYIITVTLYNNDKSLIIYYYSIEFYNLFNYNINADTKIYNYNNFLIFCSSVCNKQSCSMSNPLYSTLIIFSYPNCTDYTIDLIDDLSNNDIYINDYEINLSNFFIIDNNIFGYIFKHIKIISVFENTYLKILKQNDNNELSISYELQENEILKLYMNDNEIPKGEYIIGYAGVVTEPEFLIYNKYPEFNDTSYKNDVEYSENFEKITYTGKTTYYTIEIKEDLISNCLNDCKLCFSNSTCIYKEVETSSEIYSTIIINTDTETDDSETNKYTSDIIEDRTEDITEEKTEEKTEDITDEKTEDRTEDIIDTQIKDSVENNDISDTIKIDIIKENNCTLKDIMNNECNEIINNDQIKDTYDEITEKILKNYTKQNTVIKTKNTAFQITYYNNQTNNDNLSYVDIGICEELIKTKYDIPKEESLIILKIDIISQELSSIYVQYEIYHPYTLQKINLSICENISATINVKTSLTDKDIDLYNSLKEYGYNYFDSNDNFYNDICSLYTSKDGTDVLLSDRQKLLNDQKNVSFCQQNCYFISYNSTINMANCSCSIQTENTTLDTEDIIFMKNFLVKSFYVTLSNSNFRVMKCYKLLFSIKGQINNLGSIILFAIIFIFIILMILTFIFGSKKLKYFINIVIRSKFNNRNVTIYNNKEKKENLITKFHERRKKRFQTTVLNDKIKKTNNNLNKRKRERFNSSVLNLDKNENEKHDKGNKKAPPKKNVKRGLTTKTLNIKTKEDKTLSTKYPLKNTNINIFSINPNKQINIIKKNSNLKIKSNNKKKRNRTYSEKKVKKTNETNLFKNNKTKKTQINTDTIIFNEFEMNIFNYEKAKKYDKRNCLKYYWSILKSNHLILFIILPIEDYNLQTIKISLLLISFSLYFTTHGFFFDDNSMHKLYLELGEYKFINQLPKIVYSSLISSLVNFLLKSISLSGKNILLLKRQPDKELALIKSAQVEKCEKIKLFLFYLIGFIFLIFFWYFLGCFCAVYINTQIILLQDTIISFITSLIYPFGYYLIPAILRIRALKSDKKMNRLYNLSLLLS